MKKMCVFTMIAAFLFSGCQSCKRESAEEAANALPGDAACSGETENAECTKNPQIVKPIKPLQLNPKFMNLKLKPIQPVGQQNPQEQKPAEGAPAQPTEQPKQ